MPFDPRALDALYDIRDNIGHARVFTEGSSFEDFRASALHVYATVRALEIVSEASRRLPDDLRARHPHLPWRAIRDVGNVYRHRYENVAESYVWKTVHADLAPLLEAVLKEIGDLENGKASSD